MKTFTLNRAAKEAKIAKSTLLQAIRTGRLSAPKNDKGHYAIDPAELFRVFGQKTEEEPKPNTTEQSIETSVLQAKLELSEQRFSDAEKTIEDLRARLDASEQERRDTQRMLTHMSQQTPTEEKKGIFRKLFG